MYLSAFFSFARISVAIWTNYIGYHISGSFIVLPQGFHILSRSGLYISFFHSLLPHSILFVVWKWLQQYIFALFELEHLSVNVCMLSFVSLLMHYSNGTMGQLLSPTQHNASPVSKQISSELESLVAPMTSALLVGVLSGDGIRIASSVPGYCDWNCYFLRLE